LKRALQKFQDTALKSSRSQAPLQHKVTGMGYSCVGVVEKVGEAVLGFQAGDVVACAGAGRANHAEMVSIPVNLAVKVPAGCPIKYAATVATGAIALQGVRRSNVRVGENVAVIGLGLIGQITVQWLQVAGAHTMGFDLDPRRVRIAEKAGISASTASYPAQVEEVIAFTNGYGADATILTASSKSDTLVQSATEMTRKKGMVVVVGEVGLGLQRSPFYEKELDVVISCSYGPGRYDTSYEEEGLDYPYAYVRWTAERNMGEYLQQIAAKHITPELFVEKVVPFEQAAYAYDLLQAAEENRPLGVLLDYHVPLGEVE
jgi:threonine dehydrogenase-like Zn-dependent dehydrogenase